MTTSLRNQPATGTASPRLDTRAQLLIYLGLAALLLALQALLTTLPLAIKPGQLLPWLPVVIVAALGWVGVLLATRTGFPPLWTPAIANRRRLWRPFLNGVGLGLVLVVLDLVQPLGSDMQTPFPDSLVVFAFGGLLEEIAIHLFLLPALIWLISSLLLRGRGQTATFWTVTLVSGVAYWLLQMNGIAIFFPEKFTPALAAQLFLIIVGVIVGGAAAFRRAGFLAALSFRYGLYLVWHIVWASGIGLVRYWL
jgi:hypothetical protein